MAGCHVSTTAGSAGTLGKRLAAGRGRVPPLRSGPGCALRRARYRRAQRSRAPGGHVSMQSLDSVSPPRSRPSGRASLTRGGGSAVSFEASADGPHASPARSWTAPSSDPCASAFPGRISPTGDPRASSFRRHPSTPRDPRTASFGGRTRGDAPGSVPEAARSPIGRGSAPSPPSAPLDPKSTSHRHDLTAAQTRLPRSRLGIIPNETRFALEIAGRRADRSSTHAARPGAQNTVTVRLGDGDA
jgi:hypothetical protein